MYAKNFLKIRNDVTDFLIKRNTFLHEQMEIKTFPWQL